MAAVGRRPARRPEREAADVPTKITWGSKADIEAAPAPPDVVIVDIVMPEMGGVELLRTLAARGFGGAIVLFRGTGEPTMKSLRRVAEFRGLKVVGRIAKPATTDQLRDALAGL